MKKRNAFTLVELVAVLVIMAVIAVIVTPLILSLVNKAKLSANKKSIDAYGKAVELSVLSYLMDSGKYPTDLTTLTVEYTGKEDVFLNLYIVPSKREWYSNIFVRIKCKLK